VVAPAAAATVVVEMEIGASDRLARLRPRLLKDARGEGHTGLSGEHERVGIGCDEAFEVIVDRGENICGDGECSSPGARLGFLDD
jgi:hypothetical protein